MMQEDQNGIGIARAFLSRCRRTSSDAMSSTVLKTIIERWSGNYVSNADVIDAAQSLGFIVKPCRAPSNVAMIGVVRRDVKALRAISERAEYEAMQKAWMR